MSSMPGLKMFLQKFDRRILRKFFEHHAANFAAEIDWKETHPQLADGIYDALVSLRGKDKQVFQKLYATFADIEVLSEKGKDYGYYRNAVFSDRSLQQKWMDYFKLSPPPLDTMVMWIQIEAPETFRQLLTRKLSSASDASGGNRYFLPSNFDGTVKMALDGFRKDVKDYLKVERGYAPRVHVERNDLVGCIRFVVTTDPFPQYEQQYKENGGDDDLDVGLVKRTDCFYITYMEKTVRHPAQFSIRSGLTKVQRDQIADYFAKDVLGSRKGAKPEQHRDLSQFKSRPPDFNIAVAEEDYIGHRYVGVKMEIASGGPKPEIYMRMFNGDLYEEMAKRRELENVSDKAKTIMELYLEVTILKGERPESQQMNFENGVDDDRKEQTYLVTVRSKGPWQVKPKLATVDERKIDRILRAMDIVDVSGRTALKTKTRK